MNWGRPRSRSPWRESQFALHQLQRAIDPPLGLGEVMDNWNEIAKALAEGHRERALQLAAYQFLS